MTNRPNWKPSLMLALGFSTLLACASGCQKAPSEDPRGLTALVSVEGSDTMADLVTKWAKGFMEKNPEVPVSVGSEDSGAGIAALINQTTDLAAASRDLTEDEERLARERKVKLKKITVARDSIAVIVNRKNPVKTLSMQELKQIFSGEVRSWKPFGGAAQPISLCIREPDSGTRAYFKHHVLKDADYASGAQTLLSADAAVKSVAADRLAIAYVGMSRAAHAGDQIKIVALKLTDRSQPVAPTESSTVGDYPLSRPLMIFTDVEHKGSVGRFIDYCLSKEGQKIVADAGYAPALGH